MSFKTPSSTTNTTAGGCSAGSNSSSVVTSLSIRSEIQRFESVHPSIYSIYELIEHLQDQQPQIAHLLKEHVVNIEDSFVNSQEWTLSRSVEEMRVGILGSLTSQKSTLVHRYLTSHYMEDNSPEGGRFKKELILNGKPYMLLLRDEGGPPELQFTHWLDVLILVANSTESVKTCYSYVSRLASYKSLSSIPIVLVSIGNDTTYLHEMKKIPHNIHVNCDVVTGRNVDLAFHSAVNLIKTVAVTTPVTPRKDVTSSRNRRTSNLFKNEVELGIGRIIPLKQGYLLKKDKLKKWKKKYGILTKETFSYYDNINTYMDNSGPKIIDLKHSNVKKLNKNYFTITTLNKCYEFESPSLSERDEWVAAIEQQILTCLQNGLLVNNKADVNSELVAAILALPGNDKCADCGVTIADNHWISINFAVVICIVCSGVHRHIGSHVSKVRSLRLDQIAPWILELPMLLGGNNKGNEIYEYNLKEKSTKSLEEKSKLIRGKYETLDYFPTQTKLLRKDDVIKTLKECDFPGYQTLLLRNSDLIKSNFEELALFISFNLQANQAPFLQALLWACWEDLDERTQEKVKDKILSSSQQFQAKNQFIKLIIESL